jgi:hypothetical protein
LIAQSINKPITLESYEIVRSLSLGINVRIFPSDTYSIELAGTDLIQLESKSLTLKAVRVEPPLEYHTEPYYYYSNSFTEETDLTVIKDGNNGTIRIRSSKPIKVIFYPTRSTRFTNYVFGPLLVTFFYTIIFLLLATFFKYGSY